MLYNNPPIDIHIIYPDRIVPKTPWHWVDPTDRTRNQPRLREGRAAKHRPLRTKKSGAPLTKAEVGGHITLVTMVCGIEKTVVTLVFMGLLKQLRIAEGHIGM